MFSLVRLQAWKNTRERHDRLACSKPDSPDVFPISLVNSLRFDKSSARRPRKLVGAVSTPVSDAPGSDFLAPDRAGQAHLHRRPTALYAAGCGPSGPCQAPPPRPPEPMDRICPGTVVHCTREPCCYIENFESRPFPQAFLNHLETAASYPDSSALPGLGRRRKSVCEQRLS